MNTAIPLPSGGLISGPAIEIVHHWPGLNGQEFSLRFRHAATGFAMGF